MKKNDGGNYEKKERGWYAWAASIFEMNLQHQDISLLEEPYLLEDSKKKELIAVLKSHLELKYAFYRVESHKNR